MHFSLLAGTDRAFNYTAALSETILINIRKIVIILKMWLNILNLLKLIYSLLFIVSIVKFYYNRYYYIFKLLLKTLIYAI